MTTRGIRAVLFDKDGTLLDFRACWLAAYQDAAAALAERAGLSAAFADELLRRAGYDRNSGLFSADSPLLWATNEAIAQLWATQPELAKARDAEALVLAHFADEQRYPPVPTADLPALFDALQARGLMTGIATMDAAERAAAAARQLGIAHHLHFIAGADSGFGEKPLPGMVHAFCATVGVSPREVAVVGDSLADIEMARRAGAALAVAVTTGGTPLEALRAAADHVIANVGALPGLLRDAGD